MIRLILKIYLTLKNSLSTLETSCKFFMLTLKINPANIKFCLSLNASFSHLGKRSLEHRAIRATARQRERGNSSFFRWQTCAALARIPKSYSRRWPSTFRVMNIMTMTTTSVMACFSPRSCSIFRGRHRRRGRVSGRRTSRRGCVPRRASPRPSP